MKPLVPVAPGTRTLLGVAFFVLFIAVWAGVTFGGLVSKTFLADPLTMLKSGWTLLTLSGLRRSVNHESNTGINVVPVRSFSHGWFYVYGFGGAGLHTSRFVVDGRGVG